MTHPARLLHLAVCLLAAFAITAEPADAQSRKKKEKAAEQPVEPSVIQLPPGTQSRAVEIDKIVVRIPANKVVGEIQGGIFCIKNDDYVLRGGTFNLDDPAFPDRMSQEFSAAGYALVGSPTALFKDKDQGKAELLIGGVVTDIKADICTQTAYMMDSGGGKGEMAVEWQVYDNLARKVVLQVSTRGRAVVKQKKNGETEVLVSSFGAAVRALLSNQAFFDLAVGASAVATASPESQTAAVPPTMISRLPQLQRPFQESAVEIRGNVATVFAGSGQGSGFFVSDRHIITNAHVVGAAKFVKVRLITGREILGDVLLTDGARDVALVQTEAAGFPGLPVRTDEAAIGSAVFAIGSPLDEKNEGTVSAGVISSYRTDENLRFIQSDVNVMPGNSGGPLLDDKGNVLGLTVSGRINPLSGAPTGLNYFIPITDAMARLGLQFR